MPSTQEQRQAYSRRYWLKHRERLRAQHQVWRDSNPGWYTEYSRKNAERRLAQAKARRQKDPGKYRLNLLRQKYGIDITKYQEMMTAQGGKCAVCGKEGVEEKGKWLHVDHDHQSGKVRELLCVRCNTFLGRVENDVDRLPALLAYLIRHKSVNLNAHLSAAD